MASVNIEDMNLDRAKIEAKELAAAAYHDRRAEHFKNLLALIDAHD